MSAGTLTVVEAGAAQITDLGRRRGPRFGVPANGALDQGAARIANILAGNPDDAPLIEITAFDAEFVPDVDILVAASGAEGVLRVGGVIRPWNEPVSVRAGEPVSVRALRGGLRAYLAVRGSFDVPLLLGSCAPDSVLGFGERLAAGGAVTLRAATPPVVNPAFGTALFRLDVPARAAKGVVEVADGPDAADFAGTADRLFAAPYTVSPTSNHIGLRLTGAPLPERCATGEVLSRGVPVGAIEVPPGDELLVLHRGRGVTAGYPVLAVVTSASLDALAQVRPGERVRFRRVSDADAAARARRDRAARDALRLRVRSVFAALDVPPQTSTGRTPE